MILKIDDKLKTRTSFKKPLTIWKNKLWKFPRHFYIYVLIWSYFVSNLTEFISNLSFYNQISLKLSVMVILLKLSVVIMLCDEFYQNWKFLRILLNFMVSLTKAECIGKFTIKVEFSGEYWKSSALWWI